MLNNMLLEFREWSTHNFPHETSKDVLLGLCEEVGEICRAYLKKQAGIRGFTEKELEEEIGDAMICLLHFCQREGLDPLICLHKKWAKVKEKDFVKYPLTGRPDQGATMDTEKDWQAQRDLQILQEAKKIENDGERMQRASQEAANQKANLDQIAKQGGATDQGRNVKEMRDGIPQFH